jgi:zinc protease
MTRVFAIFLGLLAGWVALESAQGLTVDETHIGKTKIWTLHQKGAPIVGVSLIFPRGSNIEPNGLEGLMALHDGMLFEGSEHYSAQELQNFLREHGIRIFINPDLHATRLLMTAPKAHLEQALAILEEMISRPSFAPERLEHLKRQSILGLHTLSESPSYAMSRVFAKLACHGHPCEKDHTGTTQTISRITPHNIRDFHLALFNPDGVKVLVCGDLDPQIVPKLTQRVLSALPKSSSPGIRDRLPVAPLDEPGSIHYIQHPSSHASFFYYKKGLPLFHKDYFALMLANEILGGSRLSSRLYEHIRIKEGLVYSIGQSLRPNYYKATITGFSSCKTDHMDPLIKAIRQTYDTFRKNGISDDELASTKNALKGEFARRFQTIADALGTLSFFLQEDFPSDYLEKRNQIIESITKEDVRRAIQMYFDPAKLTFIVAGEKAPAQAIVETIRYPK